MANGCELWDTINQRGPKQFCDDVWGATDAIRNFNISNQPNGVVRRANVNFDDFKNENIQIRRVHYGQDAEGNDIYIRGIVTGADLDAETQVFRAVPFAAAVGRQRSNGALYCAACHKTGMRSYITCSACRIVSYCNMRCKKSHQTHHLECGTSFEFITNINEKCCIQMVLEAISAYDDDLEALKNAVRPIFVNENTRDRFVRGLPEQINDQQSRVNCVLRLEPEDLAGDAPYYARMTYSRLETLPKIADMIRGRRGTTRFLQHLTTYFYCILVKNGFNVELIAGNYIYPTRTSGLQRVLIFDAISFANHSCVPNVRMKLIGNMFVGKTNGRIPQGRELLISYIETITYENRRFNFKNTGTRNRTLMEQWGFECQCALCAVPNERVDFGYLQQRWPSDNLNELMLRINGQDFNLNQSFRNCRLFLWYIYSKTH